MVFTILPLPRGWFCPAHPKRFRESRRSFATTELPEEKVEAIRRSRMDERHAPLDKLLHLK
jgi:hypothetical protein